LTSRMPLEKGNCPAASAVARFECAAPSFAISFRYLPVSFGHAESALHRCRLPHLRKYFRQGAISKNREMSAAPFIAISGGRSRVFNQIDQQGTEGRPLMTWPPDAPEGWPCGRLRAMCIAPSRWRRSSRREKWSESESRNFVTDVFAAGGFAKSRNAHFCSFCARQADTWCTAPSVRG